MLLGYLETDTVSQSRIAAFRETLARLGWGEGRADVEIRMAGTDAERMRAQATDLLARSPDVLVVSPAQVVLVVQKMVQPTMPIVFANVPDPVAIGLVQSLNRPGGNTTGFTNFEHALAGKWLEVLKEIVPRAVRVGVAYSPENPAWRGRLQLMEAVMSSLSVRLVPAPTPDAASIPAVFDGFVRDSVDGVVVLPSIFAAAHRKPIIEAAARTRLPAVYPFAYFAAEGGLVSYGIDVPDQFRGAASYVARILRGEKPADLPVQMPSRFELVINLRTAKALGLDVPLFMQQRADEVIE
jgi:putative tryptophan/tyrosine transport system substrate-binding protein